MFGRISLRVENLGLFVFVEMTSAGHSSDALPFVSIRPSIRDLFPESVAREVIKSILRERITSETRYSSDLGHRISDSIKHELKGLDLPRYKYFVHALVGENKGEGIKVASRCLWDASSDKSVSETITTAHLFCVATVYAIYLS